MDILITGITGRIGANLAAKLLDEGHDVDAVLAQRGTNRRRRLRGPGRDLKFDLGEDLLSHV